MNTLNWADRFWSKVTKSGETDCWIWNAQITERGYGHFRLKNRSVQAHRCAFELVNGLIPNVLCVCHKCDNRKCVNPLHLFLGTNKDNVDDRHIKGRSASGPKIGVTVQGELNGHAKLLPKQVLEMHKLYASNSYTYKELSNLFQISNRTVWDIVNRKSWTHL